MGNISLNLNLQQLKHAVREMKGKRGMVKVLVLPIDENNFIEGEKGTYLNIQGYEIKNKKTDSKDTHILKQSFTKEIFEIMSDEEKRALPIIGNATHWERREPDPVSSDALSDSAVDQYEEEKDDLPF